MTACLIFRLYLDENLQRNVQNADSNEADSNERARHLIPLPRRLKSSLLEKTFFQKLLLTRQIGIGSG